MQDLCYFESWAMRINTCESLRFHACECADTSSLCWLNIPSNTWKSSLNKPCFWRISAFCSFMYASLFLWGVFGNYLFGIPGRSFMSRPRGSYWKRVGAPHWVTSSSISSPPPPLHLPIPSLPAFHFASQRITPIHPSLLLTHFYRHPGRILPLILTSQTPCFLSSSLC